jgi:hypothetical protein
MYKQVEAATSPTPDVASAPAPVMVVKVAVAPGITVFVSGVTTGKAGIATVGVIVAPVNWPVLSCTAYFTGDAVPVKLAIGLNVTVPSGFTVYVPSFGTVKVVRSQLALSVEVVEQSFTLLATSVAGDVVVSFPRIEIV